MENSMFMDKNTDDDNKFLISIVLFEINTHCHS